MQAFIVKYPNSAGRLLALFNSIDGGKAFAPQLAKMVLGETIPDNDEEGLAKIGTKAYAELHSMYQEFIEDMEAADIGQEQKNVLLKGLEGMRKSIYIPNIAVKPRVLTEAEKSLLEVCATALPAEGQLAEDDKNAIKESISDLQNLIENTETDPVLRGILLELVRLSQDSIARFNIHGARGLKRAFRGMLAEVAELYLATDEGDQAEIKETNAWHALLNHLRLIDSVAGRLLKYRPLLESASKWLLS